MHATMTELEVALLPALFFSAQTFGASTGQRFQRTWQRAVQIIRDDWQSTRYLSYGLAVLLITTALVGAYYVNHPQPEIHPDTHTYIQVAQNILDSGKFTDAFRTPGYPTFIALIFLVAGVGNLTAVSVVQGILYIFAALEIYILTILLLRRAWMALGVGVVVGTNIYVLSYVKPMLSEGLGLWLVVSLALLVVLFLQRMQARYLWLVALCSLVLYMTRPEWVYLPVLLFAYLLLIAWRRGKFRRFILHGVAALALVYLALGLYSYANGVQNGYYGLTFNPQGTLLGKILQYHMQNEAPPQYAQLAAVVNAYVAQGGNDPDVLVSLYPPLGANHWALAGAYAQSIVIHHPVEFLVDTIPVFFTSSKTLFLNSSINPQSFLGSPLLWVQRVSARTYEVVLFFPLFALFWIILFCRKRTSRLPIVEGMGAVVLLALYGLTLTSFGGYVDYMRLHASFDPLFLLVIWGTLLAAIPFVTSRVARWGWQRRTVGLIVGGLALVALVVSIAWSLLSGGLKAAVDPRTWLAALLIAYHPLWALIGLLVGVFLIWLAYRAFLAFTGSGQRKQEMVEAAEPAAQRVLLVGEPAIVRDLEENSLSEDEVQRASKASRTP